MQALQGGNACFRLTRSGINRSWRAYRPAKRDYVQAGREARRKYFSAWPLSGLLLLGGDLNPILGFYFPLFSRVFPGGISIRVENAGFQWKQNCCELLQVYVHVLRWLYPLKS